MDVLFKKEACIKKLYAMHSNKPQTYDKKVGISNSDKKYEVNNVDHNHKGNPKPKRKCTPLIDIIDNILNILLK